MPNKKFKIIVVIVIILLLSVVVYFVTTRIRGSRNLTRVCPDAWYVDRMPGSKSVSRDEYLVIRGKRAEISDYDVDWIKANCTVNKPQFVI